MKPKKFPRSFTTSLAALVCLLAFGALQPVNSQSLSGIERERAEGMLSVIKDEVKKNYYDPNFHGIDVDARFKAAAEKLKHASSLGQAFGIIAQALLDFNDSHTFFLPPPRAATADYGWRMQIIGDNAYITAVKPGSDAEAQGIKEGDLIHSVDGFKPSRANLWKMNYRYYALAPQSSIRLVVQSPDGQQRELDVKAKVKEGKRVLDLTGAGGGEDISALIREIEDDERFARHHYVELGDDLLIWKMKAFNMEADKVDEMMSKAKKRKAFILDLRGNGGGSETTLQRLIGNLIDHDVKIGDIKRRKETKPFVAKTRGGDNVFKGQLVVLVDSRSGSASELLARVVQLEKRGVVIGDRTAGAVMRSNVHRFEMGAAKIIAYRVSITDADLTMTDGKSLEHTGVTPDELLLPTAADMAAKRDPVLSRAAAIAGVTLTPEKAGALFPVEWRK